MKLSSRLLVTISAGVVGLFLVSAVGFVQIQRIHATTEAFSNHYLPTVATLDQIRINITELKAIALEMMVSHDDPEILRTLDKEFESVRADLNFFREKYRRQLILNERDRTLFLAVDGAATRSVNELYLISQVIHANHIDKATALWLKADEVIDQLTQALEKEQEFNEHLANQGAIDSTEAYRNAVYSSLLTSGFTVLLILSLAFWAYRGVVEPMRVLETKLDEISQTLDLNQRIDLGASNQMKKATEAINRLLERAQGGIQNIRSQRDEAEHEANHDPLTGLPNRNHALELLEEALRHAYKTKLKVALMFVDLDGFKAVNDIHGHDAGDHVLKEVAQRLKRTIRTQDSAARLGGDEFLVILSGLEAREATAAIAQKIITQISTAIDYRGQSITIGSSVGIAIYPEHGLEAAMLLQAADMAMYQVKRADKNGFKFFDPV